MFEQVKISYGYDALEPYMDAETVETHYGKHHATYTTNLNTAAEAAGVDGMKIEELLA
ncbi:MAG: superoxide dismutase, partial [Lachnospiraceae bacterium]|nr:superoxide dismutase [Lachnospiraceae bacterium]